MGGNFPSVIAMQIIPAAAPGFNVFPDCLAWSHISQVDVAARPKWLLLWSQHFHISLKDRLETSVQLLCSAPPGQGTHGFWGLQEPPGEGWWQKRTGGPKGRPQPWEHVRLRLSTPADSCKPDVSDSKALAIRRRREKQCSRLPQNV